MRSRNHIDRIPRRLLQSIATKQEQPKTEPKPPQFFRISPRQYSIPPAPGAAGRPAAPRAPDHPLPLPRHHCDLFPHFASGGRNRAKDPTTSRRRPVHWYFLRSRSTNKGKDRIFLLFLFLLTLLSSLVGAMSSTLLRVSPSELKIPYEVKRQRSCCMQLINKTDKYVAFKVKTTNPRKYSVRHTCGILLPRSSCSVRVTMQAPKEMQLDYHCKDKFLVQSAVARDGATMKDFVPELFIRAPGRLIEEFKLRVVYIAANPPSPVPEEAEEEDTLPASEAIGCEAKIPSTFDAASRPRYINSSGAKLSCAEELLREARSSQHGFSVIFVLFVFMSSVFIGHLMKHIKV